MPRKRKARSHQDQQKPHEDASNEDTHHSVLGGLNGGYRIDGEGSAQLQDNDATLQPAEAQQYGVPLNDKSIICERRGKEDNLSLIFTHGAGGGLANPATKDFADGFAEQTGVVTFQGNMNLQSRIKTFHAVVEHERFDAALGGRSMGARAAAIAATQDGRQTKALVLVSFPLVGGKNKDSREQILLDLPEGIDALFVIGDHDAQCDLSHLDQVRRKMSAQSWLVVVEGADHSMSWKSKSSVQEMRRVTGMLAAEWLVHRDGARTFGRVSWDGESEKVQFEGWQQDEQGRKHGEETPEPSPKKQKRK